MQYSVMLMPKKKSSALPLLMWPFSSAATVPLQVSKKGAEKQRAAGKVGTRPKIAVCLMPTLHTIRLQTRAKKMWSVRSQRPLHL